MTPRVQSRAHVGALLASLVGCVPVSLIPIDTDFTAGTMNTSGTASTSSAGSTSSTGAPTTSTTLTTSIPEDPSSSSGTTENVESSEGSSTALSSSTTGLTGMTTDVVCEPESYLQCDNGDVRWFDSCDVPGAIVEECGAGGPLGAPYCDDGDLFSDQETVGCEAAVCTSDIEPKMLENCDEAGCSEGACIGCTYTHAVTTLECPELSEANGLGSGGGNAFQVCGTTNPQTGFMTIRARKNDQSSFGERPYQVRVSLPADESCGPDANFFVISDDAPTGVGADELVFSFPSMWTPGQTEKAYCVTASTKLGDAGFDAGDPLQESWWWSDKIVVTRTCL